MQLNQFGKEYIVGIARNAVMDVTGQFLIYIDDLPQNITYHGLNNQVDSITIGPDEHGSYFRQTMTYDATSGQVATVSGWSKVTP